MDSDPYHRFTNELERLVARTSMAYEACQLAAQQADLEGHPLPAAVFRSISESYTGTTHGLLQVLATIENTASGVAGATNRNAEAAIARQVEIDALAKDLTAQARTVLGATRGEDLAGILSLVATNCTRLGNMLASLPVPLTTKTEA